jgi:hypothetical protein
MIRRSLEDQGGMEKEGIFRLNGNLELVKELRVQIDANMFKGHKDNYTVANMLKVMLKIAPF